jgi:hypothetical protein
VKSFSRRQRFPHGSRSSKANNESSKEISCFKVLDVLFGGLKASPVV